MNKSGFLLFIAVVVVAVLLTMINTYWLSYSGLIAQQKIKKIDYYLSDFTLLATQADGSMRYHVKASHLVHQQSTGSSQLYKPTFDAQDADGTLIRITAQKAQQVTKNGAINLNGNVSVVKKSSEKSVGFQLATSNLTYNPVARTLHTKDAVRLESDAGLVQGIGLSSNLDQQEIRILSNVHAEFTPAAIQ